MRFGVDLAVEALCISWLDGGCLPILDFEGMCFYLEGKDDEPDTFRWREAHSRQRFIVPMLELRVEDLTKFLQTPRPIVPMLEFRVNDLANPTPQPVVRQGPATLYVALRATYRVGAIPYVVLGLALFPMEIPGAIPAGWHLGTPDLIEQYITVDDCVTEPAHPLLREVWRVQRRQREHAEQVEATHREAKARAKKLLLYHLNPIQRAEMEARDEFFVQGQDGRTYLILPESHGNVFRVEDGRRTMNFCLVAKTAIPVYDLMLMQKLLLEADIEAFFKTANQRYLPWQHDPL